MKFRRYFTTTLDSVGNSGIWLHFFRPVEDSNPGITNHIIIDDIGRPLYNDEMVEKNTLRCQSKYAAHNANHICRAKKGQI